MFSFAKKLNKTETIINEDNKKKLASMILDIATLKNP